MNFELHDAAEGGDTAAVAQCVLRGADVNFADASLSNRAPLHFAAANGHAECMRALLESGANPLARMQGGWTAAHLAAELGHTPCLKLLFKAEPACLTAADDHGDTPLHVAQLYGQLQSLAFLESCRVAHPGS